MTRDARRFELDPPRQRRAGRSWLGTALALAGAVLMFLGWYGVSGTASVGEQLPYLASGSIPGAALIVAAAIVLARESGQHTAQRTDALIAEIHALFVEEIPAAAATIEEPLTRALGACVALPGGELFHKPDCALVFGKADITPVDAASLVDRHLAPCGVCEPDQPEA